MGSYDEMKAQAEKMKKAEIKRNKYWVALKVWLLESYPKLTTQEVLNAMEEIANGNDVLPKPGPKKPCKPEAPCH